MLRLTRTITLLILLFISGFAVAIDINTADAKSLANTLDGIGLVKAKAIVAYRNQHGKFSRNVKYPFQALDETIPCLLYMLNCILCSTFIQPKLAVFLVFLKELQQKC